MNDIFGDIFGNIFGGGGGPRQARRGADIGYVMELDLEEAVRGVERRIEIPTLAECSDCDGSGSEDGKVCNVPRPWPGAHPARHLRHAAGLPQLQRRGQIIAKPCRPATATAASRECCR